MANIAHIATVDEWESARNLGQYEVSTRGRSLEEVGFVHAVALDGIERVLEKSFAGIRYSLVLVILDADAIATDGLEVTEPSPGRWRVHGPIQTDGPSVLAALPIERVDGAFVLPQLGTFALAGPHAASEA